MTTETTPLDEADDLFSFDDMMAPGPQQSPVQSPVQPPAQPSAKAPATEPEIVAVSPEPVAARPEPVAAKAEPIKVHADKAPVAVVQEKPKLAAASPRAAQRPSPLTLVAVLVACLLNLALIGVVWRSMSGVGNALREVGDRVAHATEIAAVATPQQPSAWKGNSILAPASDEAELALEMARAEIQNGEFERARARIYSLLSVIDRFEARLRGSIAARAQVLAADSYREQANALEHPSHAGTAGFIRASTEKKQ